MWHDPVVEEVRAILQIRAKIEKLQISKESINYLAEIGDKTSLRHAVHLMTPSRILAEAEHREEISVNDVKEASLLFVDCQQSAKRLQRRSGKYLQ